MAELAGPGPDRWEVSLGWLAPDGTATTIGPADRAFPWASVTKVVTAMAVWVAVEEGSVDWDDPVGPPGATLRHVMAHASGLSPDDDRVLAAPGSRRIYSNRGIEAAAAHVEASTGVPFGVYAGEAVVEPLSMDATRFEGSPASGASGSVRDLLSVAAELMAPRLVSAATRDSATAVCFPGLAGVLPGFGSQPSNDWGLGVEVRDHKRPHWTGAGNSPTTFGHFGQTGSFLWIDRERGVAAAFLSGRPFDRWAAEGWPKLSDAILAAAGAVEVRSPD